jgi:hypothetical protein
MIRPTSFGALDPRDFLIGTGVGAVGWCHAVVSSSVLLMWSAAFRTAALAEKL